MLQSGRHAECVGKKAGDDDTEEVPAYSTKTLNISEDGMLIFSDGRIKVGDLLECDIAFDRFGMDIMLEGVKALVTRVDDTEDGKQRLRRTLWIARERIKT